jgi:hypothetical protein
MSQSGHEPTFSAFQNTVGFPPETRHSAQNVGNPLVCDRPRRRYAVLCDSAHSRAFSPEGV